MQENLVGQKMKGGRLSGQSGKNSQLKEALRHSLRSPLKKYQRGHFAALAR
jgi:hypothetical protein